MQRAVAGTAPPSSGYNPIDATNAFNRAAAAAGRQGSLGTGATTVPAGQPPAAPTLQQAASGGSIGSPNAGPAATAPSTVRGIAPVPTQNTPGEPTNAAQNQAVGRVTPQTEVANQNPAGAPGATPGTPETGGLGALTSGITNQINAIMAGLSNPGTPVDATAVFMKQSQAILGMLDQQEAQMRAENEKAGTTVDPATKFAIDQLRENLQTQLTATRENLNRRGLYDSGIELQLESNLQKGSASDQAQILSTRLSKLQDDLSKGLTSLRTQRYSTASQFGLAGANAQTSSDELGRKLGQQREQEALQGMLNLRGQVGQENTANANRASQEGISNANRESTSAIERARLAEQQRQYNETFGMEKAKYNQNFAATQAQNAIQNQNAAMQRAATAARGGATNATVNRPTAAQPSNAFGGTTDTSKNVSVGATNAAVAAAGSASSRSAALNSLQIHYADLIRNGVDVQSVMDAIDARFPPSQDLINGQRRGGAQ